MVRGRLLLTILALASACGFTGRAQLDASVAPDSDAVITDDDWLVGYAHRKAITITGGDTALEAFVVSVLAGPDAELVAGSNGRDLAFTAADGLTVLPAELTSYDPTTGALDAWVAADLLASAPTTIFLYYGGPDHTASTPWSARHAAVWHMTGMAEVTDSSPHQHHATPPDGESTPEPGAGIVGAARSYDGDDDTAIVPDPIDGSLDFPMVSFSYGLWVNVTESAGSFDIPIHKGGTSNGDPGYDMELGTSGWIAELNDNVLNRPVPFGTEMDLDLQWVQLVATVDRSSNVMTTYVNGAPATSLAIATVGSVASTRGLSLGYANYPFKGLLDEVRVYTVALSGAWVNAEYRNAADRANFIAIGSEQDRP